MMFIVKRNLPALMFWGTCILICTHLPNSIICDIVRNHIMCVVCGSTVRRMVSLGHNVAGPFGRCLNIQEVMKRFVS